VETAAAQLWHCRRQRGLILATMLGSARPAEQQTAAVNGSGEQECKTELKLTQDFVE
jgi:hypothetical protein